ncbi:MAG: PP2C family protein-serine/threonine phosphatase [Spirochaetota bacterium]
MDGTGLFHRLKRYFSADPQYIANKEKIIAYFHSQSRDLARGVLLLASVCWLGFAFDTDPKLHPDFTGLIYFRLGLTTLSVVCLVLTFVPICKPKSHIFLYLVASYAMLSCSWFTGIIADDANYVSGYQLLIMVLAFFPLRLRFLMFLYAIGAISFVLSAFLFGPTLTTPATKYSMNNLVISFVFGPFLAFFLQKFRIRLFLNHLRISEIKEKQDGDYFLTNLLLLPFHINATKNDAFVVSTFLEQKKKFVFREKEYAIGGDVNIAHEIFLADKPCIVFANGDAMGKSTQGAGGVLVFATAFEVIIERSMLSAKAKKLSPVTWLTQTFQELHNIFVKFHGSMLMSAVIGVLEKDTGKLYYVNAEHPAPVLYRDGKAQFVGEENSHYKLGTEGFDSIMEKILIQEIQLQVGDTFISASDGRDDILIAEESGKLAMNYDEELFLKHVEKGKGDIAEISNCIKAIGQLVDDLSLLSIHYLQ